MLFQLKQLLYRAYVPSRLRLEQAYPGALNCAAEFSIDIRPFSGWRFLELRKKGRTVAPEAAARFEARIPLTKEDGRLALDIVFPQEDRYILTVYADGTAVAELEAYALEDDLYARLPYKGDNHLHSYYSDGTDSPEYMAAYCRRLGYDYVVITDHYQYEPSLRAASVLDPFQIDFLVIPGEEIHSPKNPVHIISLGGTSSVNTWYREEPDAYEAAVLRHLPAIPAEMAAETRYAAAASMAVFEKIREVQGVSVLCHPGWIKTGLLHQEQDITDCLFALRGFDVLELVAGGADEMGTQLQLSYYQDQQRMPIISSSDAHSTASQGHLSLGNYTIVFAAVLTAEAVKSAIRDGFCVGVSSGRVYGPYRLVLYAYFLMERFFPSHDALCQVQGKEMTGYASGKGEIKPGCQAQTAAYSQSIAQLYAQVRA